MSDHEHTFANPSPTGLAALGLAALGLACVCLWAMFTGKVTPGQAAPAMAFWMVGGGIIQISVGIMELRNGVFKSGNVMLLFGAFFMATGCLSMFGKYMLAQHGMPVDARIEGYAWLCCAAVLIGWTPGYFKQTPLFLAIIVVLVDVALLVIGLVDIAVMGKSWLGLAGWTLGISGLLSIYLSVAIFTNTALGRVVYPIKML